MPVFRTAKSVDSIADLLLTSQPFNDESAFRSAATASSSVCASLNSRAKSSSGAASAMSISPNGVVKSSQVSSAVPAPEGEVLVRRLSSSWAISKLRLTSFDSTVIVFLALNLARSSTERATATAAFGRWSPLNRPKRWAAATSAAAALERFSALPSFLFHARSWSRRVLGRAAFGLTRVHMTRFRGIVMATPSTVTTAFRTSSTMPAERYACLLAPTRFFCLRDRPLISTSDLTLRNRTQCQVIGTRRLALLGFRDTLCTRRKGEICLNCDLLGLG